MKLKPVYIALAGLLSSNTVSAAGFALIEQSASSIGNAYAGAAAVAEDASTIFFNPAGMTYVQGTQLVGALHFIKPNIKFDNKGSSSGSGRPLGDEGGDAGSWAFLPNFYYKRDLSETVKFGFGINTPFGLKTEYDRNWIGRFQGVKSDLKTININPSLAFKINDQLSLGFGLSAMYAEAQLTRAVNLGAAESFADIKGKDWGFGYNLGAIYQMTQDTRVGLAYRSKVHQHLDGKAKFDGAAAVNNSEVTADATLPESLSFSAFSSLNQDWDLLADVTWTRWSQFQELRIKRNNDTTLTVTPEHWRNVIRYSLGVNYKYSDTLKLRAGVAYDEEPISTEFRTVRIPGNDRKWLSMGASYQYTPSTKFDVGYAHLFISDTKIDDNQTATLPLGNGRVRGEYKGHADILSVQLTHNF